MVSTRRTASKPQVAVNDYPPERQRQTVARARRSKSAQTSQEEWPTGKQPQNDEELYKYRMWFYKNTLDPHRRIAAGAERRKRALELAWCDRRDRHAQGVAKKYADLHLREEAFDFAKYDAMCNDWTNKSLESEHLPVSFGNGAFEGPRPERGHIEKAENPAYDLGDEQFSGQSMVQDDFEVWIDTGAKGVTLNGLRHANVDNLPAESRPGGLDGDFKEPQPGTRQKGSMSMPWKHKQATAAQLKAGDQVDNHQAADISKKTRSAKRKATELTSEDDHQAAKISKKPRIAKRKISETVSNDASLRDNHAKKSNLAHFVPQLMGLAREDVTSTSNVVRSPVQFETVHRPPMLFNSDDRVAGHTELNAAGTSNEGRTMVDEMEERNFDHGDFEFKSYDDIDDDEWEEYVDDGSVRRH